MFAAFRQLMQVLKPAFYQRLLLFSRPAIIIRQARSLRLRSATGPSINVGRRSEARVSGPETRLGWSLAVSLVGIVGSCRRRAIRGRSVAWGRLPGRIIRVWMITRGWIKAGVWMAAGRRPMRSHAVRAMHSRPGVVRRPEIRWWEVTVTRRIIIVGDNYISGRRLPGFINDVRCLSRI